MTKIFNSYSEFIEREDKTINGVSVEFAAKHPEWEKENENNKACWNCSRCSRCSGCFDCSGCSGCSRCSGCFDCSGCSGCSRCSGCSGCSRCSRCSGCFDCSGCSRCSRCSGCFDCSGCSRCSGCFDCSGCSGCSRCFDCSGCSDKKDIKGEKKILDIPVIKNIHTTILDAVSKPKALKMDSWHTCNSTHCRAGWVVHLSGKQGYDLEKETSTLFAAMQIYKASSDIKVSPVHFFDSNDEAMADIKRCAEEEMSIATK